MRGFRKAILSALICLLAPSNLKAQCGDQLPPWLAQDLTGRLLQDTTHTYFVGRASAPTEEAARVLARKDAEAQIASCNFLTIASKSSVKKELHVSTESGKTAEQGATEARREVTTAAQAHASGVRELTSFACEQQGGIGMTVIVSVPRDQLPAACGRTVDYPTPGDFLWRSALLPGWGQFYKGDRATGYTILLTELLTIPVAVFTNVASRSERDKASESTTQGDRDVYNQRADTLFYVSAGAGAVAVGMYLFNVLNAYSGSPSYGLGETRTGSRAALRVGNNGTIGLDVRF